MIDPKELRLGNAILEAGELSTVYSLNRGGITFYRINDINVHKDTGRVLDTHEDRFAPIPLSPAILEAMGFTPCFISQYQTRYEHKEHVFMEVQVWNGGKINLLYKSEVLRAILYVHELQNLYFAITGQELTLQTP
jgi:hypothetical protein